MDKLFTSLQSCTQRDDCMKSNAPLLNSVLDDSVIEAMPLLNKMLLKVVNTVVC